MLFDLFLTRSRSRSPSEARAKLPTELTRHFEFDLVEPASPSMLKVQYTDKKENQIFLICREIQSGAVAKCSARDWE